MSNLGMIIEERTRDIGDFIVGRLLPFRSKRMVGPFIFIDHMGPTVLGNGHYMDIDRHPHIGLSTLTFMLEGEIMHRDSLGTVQRISPGSVNWMVAGRGVTHTERTPEDWRDRNFTAHGYQIWVALPKELEDMEPEFHHYDASELPEWQDKSAQFKLVAGEGYGQKSPVAVHSDLFMVEIKNTDSYSLDIAQNLKGEVGICIVEGRVEACGQLIEAGNMLVSKTEDACKLLMHPNTHLLLFGGKPFDEERFIFWNFVSHSKEKIEQAKINWKNDLFPKIEGDTTYVKMPE